MFLVVKREAKMFIISKVLQMTSLFVLELTVRTKQMRMLYIGVFQLSIKFIVLLIGCYIA